MESSVVISRKVIYYQVYQLTKSEFVEKFCMGLSTLEAEHKWKQMEMTKDLDMPEKTIGVKVEDEDDGISEEEVEEFVESLPFRPVENLHCVTKNCPNLRLKHKDHCPECLFKLYGSY